MGLNKKKIYKGQQGLIKERKQPPSCDSLVLRNAVFSLV